MSLIQFRSFCSDLFLDLAVYFDVFCWWVLRPWTWYWSLLSVIITHTHTHCMLTYIRLYWRISSVKHYVMLSACCVDDMKKQWGLFKWMEYKRLTVFWCALSIPAARVLAPLLCMLCVYQRYETEGRQFLVQVCSHLPGCTGYSVLPDDSPSLCNIIL